MGDKKICLILSFLFLLFGCSSTVENMIHDPDFISSNHPIRFVKAIIVTEDEPDKEEIGRWLNECSHCIKEQVGIEIIPYIWMKEEKLPPVNSRSERLTALYRIAKKYSDWDIVIDVSEWSTLDYISHILFFSTTEGYVDDYFRRIVVLKNRNCQIFAHEIFHLFIFSHNHSGGVMSAFKFKIFPFTPTLNSTIYLTKEDREEVLGNKWRDFNQKPSIAEKEDMIEEQ